jgi:MscS family membrane protein
MVYTFTKTVNWVYFHEVKQDVLIKILNIIHRHEADIAFPTQTLNVVTQTNEEPPAQ